MRSVNDKDIETIMSWYQSRGLVVERSLLSSSGFIVDNTCACFLYLSLDNVAMIEGVVSNPMASPFDVHRGIIELIKGAEQAASKVGAKHIIGIVSGEGMINIGKQLGYEDRGTYRVLMKGI